MRFPLTGAQCVKKIITDIAVIEVVREGLLLTEIAKNWNYEYVQSLTEPKLIISADLKEYSTII